jgi:MFS family permease
VAEDFNISTTLAISPTSLYGYGLAIGSLFATAASESFGRRIVYQVTIPLSLVFTILGGSAQNFVTLAVARFLAGIFSGPCLTVGVGVLNDLWNVSLDKTGTAFAVLYALFSIYATQIGPMASGSVMESRSWRWTFWLSAILTGLMAVSAFLLPETYVPEILRSQAKLGNRPVPPRGAAMNVFLVSVGRPLHMIIIEPVSFSTSVLLMCGIANCQIQH